MTAADGAARGDVTLPLHPLRRRQLSLHAREKTKNKWLVDWFLASHVQVLVNTRPLFLLLDFWGVRAPSFGRGKDSQDGKCAIDPNRLPLQFSRPRDKT